MKITKQIIKDLEKALDTRQNSEFSLEIKKNYELAGKQ